MTEYCTVHVTDSWEPDTDPSIVIEYEFTDANASNTTDETVAESPRPHSRDHLSVSLSSLPDRLLVTHRPSSGAEDSPNCQITLRCKQHHSIDITGVSVVSEARLVEVYDAKDGSYLQTVRGSKDKEDSEADNSRVHFLCKCHLERALQGITVKFMSLGQRVSFEIAHIRVQLQASLSDSGGSGRCGGMLRQTIDMDRLRQDVNDMGDGVSDRAKAFLTILENFQKNRHGGLDEVRQMLLEKNCPEGMGQSMAGITALLSVFTSSQSRGSDPSQAADSFPTEGSMMNHMLTQMIGQLALGGSGRKGQDSVGMYRFLQSVCSQVSQQRGKETEQDTATMAVEQAAAKGDGDVTAASSVMEVADLEKRVKLQVEVAMASSLSAVEEHIRQQVDQRMEELESRMSSKLDAIFNLLQQQQQKQ